MSNFTLKATIAPKDIKPFESRIVITKKGILSNHIEYLARNRGKSQSWRNQSCSAIVKFLDYVNCNDGRYKNPRIMFEAFSNTLVNGTINDEGNDPLGLWWEPLQPKTVNDIINHVTRFSQYIYNKTKDESHLLNPEIHASRAEFLISLAAYHHKKNNSFFAHTFNDQAAIERARHAKLVKNHNVEKTKEIKATEEIVILDLITNGFWRSKNRSDFSNLNLKNVLITMLLSYAGLRLSEPFHIFITDIYDDPIDDEQCFICVQHNSIGEAPEYWRRLTGKKVDRGTYLRQKYGLRPRTEVLGSLHIGWKSLHKTSFYVYMFPSKAGKWFKVLLDLYIKSQRKVSSSHPHPYLFSDVNGNPATIRQYTDARSRALLKLGHDPSKYSGNNPHGGRHFYGSSLEEAGVNELHIKEALHHASLSSQEVYKESALRKKMRKSLLEIEHCDAGLEASKTSFSPLEFCNGMGL